MKQILHIFAKDARRFWPEILVSLGITAAFVVIEPQQWLRDLNPNFEMHNMLVGLLCALVPISWWILIARVIHAERLVGDTQYWLTRPCTWQNLLAAKVLFLLSFLVLPFTLAQFILLAEAGFHPLPLIPGPLHNLLLITVFVLLPLAALAVVTSNLVRMTLTMLGVLLTYTAFFAIWFMQFIDSFIADMPNPLRNTILFWIATASLVAAIVVQYALRKVWIARGILLALPIVLFGADAVISHFDRARIDHIYPAVAAQSTNGQVGEGVQISYHLVDPRLYGNSSYSFGTGHVSVPILLQLKASGVADDQFGLIDGIRAEITAPDGSHWNSDWQGSFGTEFSHYNLNSVPSVRIPMDVYEKYRSMPLQVRFFFAVSHARVGKTTTLPLPEHSFSVPDFGVCSLGHSGQAFGDAVGVKCLSPLGYPPLTVITTRWSDQPCSAAPNGNTSQNSGPEGLAIQGTLDPHPSGITLTPIEQQILDLNNSADYQNGVARQRSLCPGTPITFTEYKLLSRAQGSLTVQGLRLPTVTRNGNMIYVSAPLQP
jgi:hypothetical protein